MMYFREDAKRPMECSREHFDSEWDRIFEKNTEPHLSVERCTTCTRYCFDVGTADSRKEWMVPFCKIIYVGYCTVKRKFIFEEVSELLYKGVSFTVPKNMLCLGYVSDVETMKLLNHREYLIPKNDRKHLYQ